MTKIRLFSKYSVFDVVRNQKDQVKNRVDKISSKQVLELNEDELFDFVYAQLELKVPTIQKDNIYYDQSEVQVDISGDPRRYFTQRPYYVTGTRTKVMIPFSGDEACLHIQPSIFSSAGYPSVELERSEIILTYDQENPNGENIKRDYEKVLREIENYFASLTESFNQVNNEIKPLIRQQIARRKETLIAGASIGDVLGLPKRTRSDTPTNYSIKLTKRAKPEILLRPASSTTSAIEPALANSDYEYILTIMKLMVEVMERSPKAFESMDEEAIRTNFLVHINAQYEGMATGETFNFAGKTDIFLNIKGKNVFIAECKFWGGEKVLLETINQLLGYLSWRDTKTAVVMLNRNKNFTNVLKTIEAVVPTHACHKRSTGKDDENVFRYVFRQPDDNDRELLLTVMAFNVPTKK